MSSSDPHPSAEARAIVHQWTIIDPFYGPLLTGEVNHLTRLIDVALREREREALERAAKAICWLCAMNVKLDDETHCWHGDQKCQAAGMWPLRALGDRSVDRAEAGMGKTDFEKDGGAY